MHCTVEYSTNSILFYCVQLEKDELMRDLQAVRDLAARLEASRDQLQQQLHARTSESGHVHLNTRFF